MKKNYKPIGDYIRVVNNKNKNQSITQLIGLSIDKCYINSVANIIGADLSTYKVIKKNQFACSLMQVSRDEKIPIACMIEHDKAIMSPAYVTFEVIDENIVLPEYLNMWFMRSEFDREASFLAVGGVRGSLAWDDFCQMKFPLLSIDKQKEIVRIYRAIEDRIALKKNINDNLEAQATTLFHSIFDKQNSWLKGTVADLGQIIGGATPSKDINEFFCNDGIVWLTPKDLTSTGYKFIYKGETDITEAAYNSCSTKLMAKGTVLLTSRAPVGIVAIAMTELCTNQGFKSIVPYEKVGTPYLYYFLKENRQLLESHSSGTTFMEISGNVLRDIPTFIPPEYLTKKFSQLCTPIFALQQEIEAEIRYLKEFQQTIISLMSSR